MVENPRVRGRNQGPRIRDQGSVRLRRRGAAGGGAVVPAPRAATAGKETVSHPVPNTVTTRTSSTTEIASLSQQPDRVQATSKPTSQPISAVVGGAGPQPGPGAQGPGSGNQGNSFVVLASPNLASTDPAGATPAGNAPSTA